jgi:signal transduction histidine kinase
MRERLESAGGTLVIDTGEGRGFELRATVPLRSGR